MEINVETAVRVCSPQCSNELICVQSNPYNNTIQLGNGQRYQVNYALPEDCPQSALYASLVSPLLSFLLEGYDVSVVGVGQSGTGKTYTLLGPGFNCVLSESEYGVIPRFLRDLFAKVLENRERTSTVHITWSQICGENVQDLLGAGSVECKSVGHAIQLIQVGFSNLAPRYAHSLFTITLEQRWLLDNVVQHRISTASFADLAGSEKIMVMDSSGVTQSIPSDPGLLALQRCIMSLTEPYNNQFNVQVPYNQSVLTTLLKDSFGGRAKTLLICTVSPLLRDYAETFYTMQNFALRGQMIKNLVTVNSYTVNETTIQENFDVFGLQFAANQLFKLVTNAEELFQKLMANNSLSQNDLEQVSQWLTLKQECEECLSETSEPHRSLERIEEEIEDSFDSSESENENENILIRLNSYMDLFRLNTEALVSKTNTSQSVSKSVTKESTNSSNSEYHNKGARGRRNSIHSVGDISIPSLITTQISEEKNEAKSSILSFEAKQKILKQINNDLQGCQKQIRELETTIAMQEKSMQQLVKHKNTKASARDKIEQKRELLKTDYQDAQFKFNQIQHDQKLELELKEIEQKIKDIDSIKNITEDGNRRMMELESSLHTSKKQLDKLKKYKRKEEKRKILFENEVKLMKKSSPDIKIENKALVVQESNWICDEIATPDEKLDALRHEIRNLRRTRELLLEQRCKIDSKSHIKTFINELEERKLIQYEEAIEAIDLAIEYKNELICGHEKALATPQELTDKMLLERLMKLNEHEMRALLHKYFEKVVDLRSNSKKLELQVVDAECQNDNLTGRLQNLSHTLQQVRLEAERRIVFLQHQHEDKLNTVMRILASDGSDKRVIPRIFRHSREQASVAFRVAAAGTRKHENGGGGSIIAKISDFARHETVPRQLQPAPSQAKVTKQKNKLIITQNKK